MTTTCPLCGDECGTRDRVRRHLHVHHRKFELIDRLLDDRDLDPRGPEPVLH